MIKELIKLANHLDSNRLSSEANFLDSIIVKMSNSEGEKPAVRKDGGTVCYSCRDGYSLSENDHLCYEDYILPDLELPGQIKLDPIGTKTKQ